MRVGVVAELWVYPVKSMRGERVNSVALDPEGIRGDRRFAVESRNAAAGKPLLTGRERATMLLHHPETIGGEHFIRVPQGDRYALQSTELLESFAQGESEGASSFSLKASPAKPLTDVRPVSLVSTSTIAAPSEEMGKPIDPQRFRSNIVLRLDGSALAEEAWSGRTLRFGEGESAAELQIRERIPRCRMVSLDPRTAEPDHTILRHLARAHEGKLGVYGTVRLPGLLEEGQAVYLL